MNNPLAIKLLPVGYSDGNGAKRTTGIGTGIDTRITAGGGAGGGAGDGTGIGTGGSAGLIHRYRGRRINGCTYKLIE